VPSSKGDRALQIRHGLLSAVAQDDVYTGEGFGIRFIQ